MTCFVCWPKGSSSMTASWPLCQNACTKPNPATRNRTRDHLIAAHIYLPTDAEADRLKEAREALGVGRNATEGCGVTACILRQKPISRFSPYCVQQELGVVELFWLEVRAEVAVSHHCRPRSWLWLSAPSAVDPSAEVKEGHGPPLLRGSGPSFHGKVNPLITKCLLHVCILPRCGGRNNSKTNLRVSVFVYSAVGWDMLRGVGLERTHECVPLCCWQLGHVFAVVAVGLGVRNGKGLILLRRRYLCQPPLSTQPASRHGIASLA